MASNKYSDAIIAATDTPKSFLTSTGIPKVQICNFTDLLPNSDSLFHHLYNICILHRQSVDDMYTSKFDCAYLLSILSDKEMEELIYNWNI